jgi:hypothetical protein
LPPLEEEVVFAVGIAVSAIRSRGSTAKGLISSCGLSFDDLLHRYLIPQYMWFIA